MSVGSHDPRVANLDELREIIETSKGPRQVIAITNGGDGPLVAERLRAVTKEIFRADGATRVFAHEERVRRGQLLGLLDAQSAVESEGFTREGVALGIMLPGKGTRLSPLTQRLHGIKPFLPMLIRRHAQGPWLSGASASLFSWTLVAYHLERMGFRGVAWKWGDEPQIPALSLSALDLDLSHTDALRFGSEVAITEDLARNKEWLHRDEASAELVLQVRRRSRAELLSRFGLSDDPLSNHETARALVHIGSPALSYAFLEEAHHVLGDLEGWLDVDGYLFEALTHDLVAWEGEIERDPGLRALLAERPDFYARAREIKTRLEDRNGRALSIKVIDFGADLYWGDIGQLQKARDGYRLALAEGRDGSFARRLAAIEDHDPDPFGNILVGTAKVPEDGSVRNSLIVDSSLEHTRRVEESVIVGCSLGNIEAAHAVAFECHCGDLTLERDAFAFRAMGDTVTVESDHVLTTLPKDPKRVVEGMEHLVWDSRQDPGAKGAYDKLVPPNAISFAEKFEQMRQREMPPDGIEAAIKAEHGAPAKGDALK